MRCAAPLRALTWDGFTITLRIEPGRAIELHLDGARFASWPAGAERFLRQAFSFPPNGRTHMRLQPFCDGLPLHAPVEVAWGEPGLQAATYDVEPMRLLSPHAETYMPGTGVTVPVVIIVPVFNASAAVARCLTALREYTPDGARLLLIDDASTDPAMAPLLGMAATWPHVRVERNARNRGFTPTVNRGLDACPADADVVLLNADTEVGPGWLAGLRQAAWARREYATATAVSDNAGAFSVPEMEQINALPQAWRPADAARVLLHQAGRAFPALPTGNGFCMYIRHDARAQVGKLDEEAFPAGYGEENDWCQRAERLGWQHVIAGSVLVCHARSQSFGAVRREQLGRVGMEVLRRRYPTYEARVAARLHSFPRQVLDWRVRQLWRAAGAAPRPRVLVYGDNPPDRWGGWSWWRLHTQGPRVRLLDADGNERGSVARAQLLPGVAAWLQRYGFEAVGAEAGGELIGVCRRLGIPMATTADALRWAFR